MSAAILDAFSSIWVPFSEYNVPLAKPAVPKFCSAPWSGAVLGWRVVGGAVRGPGGGGGDGGSASYSTPISSKNAGSV
eukprot:CAMPEP_0197590820 /NCGR_PEP_ID=MMETSP1326-20131121/12233_1 /TAXON_ID=1155430 /ORGANISM="Genus nov. species nov., Strain RCC2288" /LENGTH=77 /DNA_ID=CAMNT_0043156101 /DNA_START=365 /DNA_END=598 /DNA_ORIENTATION=+